MSKLEKRLRELAKAGELYHLSVIPVAGKGPNSLVFAATYSPPVGKDRTARNADPIEAMLGAVTPPETEPWAAE